jgi:hypothetical protein
MKAQNHSLINTVLLKHKTLVFTNTDVRTSYI